MVNQYDNYNDVRQARRERDLYGIPSYVYQPWRSQFHSSRKRGIPFRFGLLQWHRWWQEELRKIGPNAKRGLRRGEFMMCRVGDQGAYEPGNVYCGTARQNQADVTVRDPNARRLRMLGFWADRKAAGIPCHLAQRGDRHPRSRAVITPEGRYGSAALAAEAAGITRQGASARALAQLGGWRYENPPNPALPGLARPD